MGIITLILFWLFVAFVLCTILIVEWKVDRLIKLISDLLSISSEPITPQWGDYYINWEGREVQLPEECPEGFDMAPEDFILMNSRPPQENWRERDAD